MTSATRIVRGARRRLGGAWRLGLRKSVAMLGGTPRVAYMHYWTLREEADSLVTFHNYFSLLDPDARGACRADLRLYDAAGRTLASRGLDVPARGCAQVSVRALLRTAGAPPDALEGSVELDVLPPEDFSHERNETGSFEVSAARFFMIYRSPAGMMTTAHCLEKTARYRGLPSPFGGLLKVHARRPGAWCCKRPISARNLSEVRAVAVNYADEPRALHLALWAGAHGEIVAEAHRVVAPRGVLALEYRGVRADAPFYTLHSDALPTPNGKPYLWVRYGDGPMAMHHA